MPYGNSTSSQILFGGFLNVCPLKKCSNQDETTVRNDEVVTNESTENC